MAKFKVSFKKLLMFSNCFRVVIAHYMNDVIKMYKRDIDEAEFRMMRVDKNAFEKL
jgi:hypothetical protein